MSKWFEVTVTSVKVFSVEVEDAEGRDEAMAVAMDEAPDWCEIDCDPEMTDPVDIDRSKRHADEVFSIGEDEE